MLALSPTIAAGQPAHFADPVAQRLAKAVGERFGVTVLKAEPAAIDGHQLYRIVVMNPGGDFNSAYEVRTLLIDPETGELVPAFQQEQSGYRTALPADREPNDDGVATTIRRESFAKP